jgi:thiol-disulfide isomerase/thioredoxin
MSPVISALGLIALLSNGAAVPARSIEGRPAPQIEGRRHIGPRVPAVGELKGKVVLFFFWAHWCSDCKAEGPIVAGLLDKYRSRGLAIIAPTQEFGYVEGGRPAPPDKELRHIIQVRDTYYPFLRNEPVPISEVNIRQYGVDSVPTLVLLDREGIARVFHPGRMTEEELEAAILELL